jgi:hypothetical protein
MFKRSSFVGPLALALMLARSPPARGACALARHPRDSLFTSWAPYANMRANAATRPRPLHDNEINLRSTEA